MKRLLLMALLSFTLPATATNLVFDTNGKVVGSYVGARSLATDWVVSQGAAGGARFSSTGTSVVPTIAGEVRLPTTLGGTFTAARAAATAAKVARAVSGIGTAFLAYEIYNAVKDSGIRTCPAPDFFCVPAPDDAVPPVVDNSWFDENGFNDVFPNGGTSGQAVCDYYATTARYSGPRPRKFVPDATPVFGTASGKCFWGDSFERPGEAPYTEALATCPVGTSLSGGLCVKLNPTLIPANEVQIKDAIAFKQTTDNDYSRRLAQAWQNDNERLAGSLTGPLNLAPSDLPMDVSAQPATAPNYRASTETITNPDGTTSTKTVDQQVTVSPQVSGNTLSDTVVSYPTTAITTTTITNNTTNQTTTTVNTSTSAPDTTRPTDGQQEPETGPKECGSPGKPKCLIDESGTPTTGNLTTATQQLTKTQTDAAQLISDAANTAGKATSWNFSFSLPSGCTPYTLFLGIVINYCQFQPVIHDIMSLVWVGATIFLIIGMFGRAARGG